MLLSGCSILPANRRPAEGNLVGRTPTGATPFGTPDCVLSGRGDVYSVDKTSGGYKNDEQQSYALSAARFPLKPGTYLYQERKKFSDGSPDQQTVFAQSTSVAPFSFSAPDGSLKSEGVCTRRGHCAGTLSIPAASFSGRFVTDFDSTGIRTVTFSDDGSFVDEVLIPAGNCQF